MTYLHTLGYPRIGLQRELKFALEAYWKGRISAAELEGVARKVRAEGWQNQADAGLTFVTVGDFALYDQTLNQIQWLGCEPPRFGFTTEDPLSRYFIMARGSTADGVLATERSHGAALEMTKWFDTNYHYLVPELDAATTFTLSAERLLGEVMEAQSLGHRVKVALIGPLTFLWLAKSKQAEFDPLSLREACTEVYAQLLKQLANLAVEWVQLDEPILGVDLPETWRQAFAPTYRSLYRCGIRILLATYFGRLEENLDLACGLDIDGLHVDAVRSPGELRQVAQQLPPARILSAGVVDGRNVWRNDLARTLDTLVEVRTLRPEGLWLAPSCSLLHAPLDLHAETKLDWSIRPWLAFARQKLWELATLGKALDAGVEAVREELAASRKAAAARAADPRVRDAAVRERIQGLGADVDQRGLAWKERLERQRVRLDLPLLPTTTIGSFPQTETIRTCRGAFRRGEISEDEYRTAMQEEIEEVIRHQERLGLDVLVHGEPERNDMVEYFGEQLAGFVFTEHAWVQSYGSRCVKPPIIFGDVHRRVPMTVPWSMFAQSLTTQPVKGMLTGPITLLQWSFVRDDQERELTALQLALAIRDEVRDLEHAGLSIIQIDEPALREGLPLRQADAGDYLRWAARSFRIAAAGAGPDIQVHTHMCYAEFDDIMPAISALEADVITLESSRSDMEVLDALRAAEYPGEVGPGLWDVHSPVVPTVEELGARIRAAAERLPLRQLWANPDCGLKTRGWEETTAALVNLVEAARRARESA